MKYSEWLKTETGRRASGGRTLAEWMKAEASAMNDGELLAAVPYCEWPYGPARPADDDGLVHRKWAGTLATELVGRYRQLLGADNRTPLGKCDAAKVTMPDGTVWTVPKMLADGIEKLKRGDFSG